MRNNFICSIILLCSIIFPISAAAEKPLKAGFIPYDESLVKIAGYFINDMMVSFGQNDYKILPKFKELAFDAELITLKEAVLQTGYRTVFLFKEITKEGKTSLSVRYLNFDKPVPEEKIFKFLPEKTPLRYISLECIKDLYQINLYDKLTQKTLAIFLLDNMANNKEYGFLNEMVPNNIGSSLMARTKTKIIYSYQKDELFRKLKLDKTRLSAEQALEVVKELKADAGLIGNFVVSKNQIIVTVFILDRETKETIFSFKENLPMSTDMFSVIDRIGNKTVELMKTYYPAEPVKIMVLEKETRVEKVVEKVVEKEKIIEKVVDKPKSKYSFGLRLYMGSHSLLSAGFELGIWNFSAMLALGYTVTSDKVGKAIPVTIRANYYFNVHDYFVPYALLSIISAQPVENYDSATGGGGGAGILFLKYFFGEGSYVFSKDSSAFSVGFGLKLNF